MYDGFLFFEVVGPSPLDSTIEDQEIVTNPPDICQVVEVTTESDEQPVSMSELYPLQISPVSSYAGKGAGAAPGLSKERVGAGGCPCTAKGLSSLLGVVLALIFSTSMTWTPFFSEDIVPAFFLLDDP